MLDALLSTFIVAFHWIVQLYIWIIVIAVVASWLLVFGVVNMRNDAVRSVVGMLNALTEPVFRRVRKIIPPIGGLDLSPLIVILALTLFEYFLDRLIANIYSGHWL